MGVIPAEVEAIKRVGLTKPLHVPPQLPQAVKSFLTVRLAQFASPAAIQAEAQEQFGVLIPLPVIRRYDVSKPLCSSGRRLRELFHETRNRYLSDVSDVGIAHQSHRLNVLHRMAEKAEDSEQWGTVASLLKQAAEEMGGTFTNARTVTHRGGLAMVHLNPEDAKAELAQRLGSVIGQLTAPQEDTKQA